MSSYEGLHADGLVAAGSVDYATVQAAASAGSYYGGVADRGPLAVGQAKYDVAGTTYWSIDRTCLLFNTAGLGAGYSIDRARISLYCESDQSATDFNLVVVSGSAIANPPVFADYGDLLAATASRGSLSSSALVVGAYNKITLNATGLGEINTTGVTKFGIRSSRDISATEPALGVWEYAEFNSINNTGSSDFKPLLEINYTESSEVAGVIAIVGDTVHYIGKSGVEYVIQGTAV